jgi:ADP-ribose pyrophosphatase
VGHPIEPERVEVVFRGSRLGLDVEHWPGGSRREIVRHPGACAAVVFVDEDRVVLVRQFREAVRRSLLEVPAGTRDVPGETEKETVRREILEETGYRAARVVRLGSILTTPGFSDERIGLYVAWVEPGPPVAPEEPGVETVLLRFDDAVRMVHAGEIEDAKSCVALLLARATRAPSGPRSGQGGRVS